MDREHEQGDDNADTLEVTFKTCYTPGPGPCTDDIAGSSVTC